MAKTTTPSADDYPALADLAQSLLVDVDLPAPASGTAGDDAPARLSLALGDLIADGSGELVLDAQGQLDIRADSEVVGKGEAAPHLTEGGEDVGGLTYVAFASGITLYYPGDLDLNVISGGA